MRKISLKLGILFLIFVLGIEIVLFISLYLTLVDTRIEEEFAQLLARGNSHRDVLEKHYSPSTFEHVVMMESESETDVVITNEKGELLYYSSAIYPIGKQLVASIKLENAPYEGTIVQGNWESGSHISTVSPIQCNGEKVGYVIMFQNTDSIRNMISKLKHHFILVGILTVLLTIGTIMILTRAITFPLIRMKQATEKLSKGDFSVRLHMKGGDELAELGNAIQTLARDLEYLKKERNEFLASISHELRTPLTYVKGYAEVAKRPEIDETNRRKYLTIIYEEAENMEKLVKDLFELAKIDQHTFHIEKEETSLYPFLEKICDKMTPAFLEKNVQLMLKCDQHIDVHIDRKRFGQVMMNLLDNALKHSKPQSNVWVEGKKINQKIVLTVTDQGTGIPVEDLPHIFDRLYRVDKSRSRSTGGTGLGLSIVKEIVEAHGGSISVESELHKGTKIIITLLERE